MSDELSPLVSKRQTAAERRQATEAAKLAADKPKGDEPQWVLNCRREPDPDFGPFIKERRRFLNLTQEEVAFRAYIKRRHLIYVEQGQRRCSYQLAQRLSSILGVRLTVPPPDLPAPDPLEPTWRDSLIYHNVWQRSDENKMDPRRPRRQYRKAAASLPATEPIPGPPGPGFGVASEKEFKRWQLQQPVIYRREPEVKGPPFFR